MRGILKVSSLLLAGVCSLTGQTACQRIQMDWNVDA